MSLYVVDASAGVKWPVPEIHSTAALRLQDPAHELHVPAFFDIEIGNALWKKLGRGELTRAEADDALNLIPTLPVLRHDDGLLVRQAFDLAAATKRTVYDCSYLALAVQLGAQLVTADEKFVNALAVTSWAASIIRVQDVP